MAPGTAIILPEIFACHENSHKGTKAQRYRQENEGKFENNTTI
jgi:hypothetical protein